MTKPDRKSIRLPGFDYSLPGAYFITICVQDGESHLGEIHDGRMTLNPIGKIAVDAWAWLEHAFTNVLVDIFCIMPNHVHAIIRINNETARRGGITPPLPSQQTPLLPEGISPSAIINPALGQIVAYFKYTTTKQINLILDTPGIKFWQRNYYEHIIRDEKSYDHIWEYIETNPLRWEDDEYYP